MERTRLRSLLILSFIGITLTSAGTAAISNGGAAVSVGSNSAADNDGAWRKVSGTVAGEGFVRVKVDPRNPDMLYALSSRALMRWDAANRSGRVIFSLPVGDNAVDVHVSEKILGELLVASDHGLWRSVNDGKDWERIFDAGSSAGKKVAAVTELDGNVYLGTREGLYFRRSSDRLWQEVRTGKMNRSVRAVFPFHQDICWATDEDFYRFQPEMNVVTRLFGLTASHEETAEIIEEEDLDISEETRPSGIRTAGIFDTEKGEFFVLTDEGIFIGREHLSWQRLSVAGLDNLPHTGSAEGFFAVATERGIYFREGETWKSLYRGLDTTEIADLEFSPAQGGMLYTATENGVYALPVTGLMRNDLGAAAVAVARKSEDEVNRLRERLDQEPSINVIQHLAVDYAEVHPEKIQEWRRLARKRAWLPSLDIGFDGGADWSRNDSVFGSSSSGGSHYLAPDDKTSGGDTGWDVGLSWDLADLVWSNDQTSIDSRSKLMVELRDDIINQVTRIYFERRRMQIELATLAHPTWEERVDKELRIEELTALIDGLTGGKFSAMMDQQERTVNRN